MSEDKEIGKSHGKWHGGKGSARKDKDNSKYADNWDKIFGRKNKDLSDREKVLMDPLAASQRSDAKNKTPNTLQEQAWKRAVENKRPKVATPYEWEDYERKEKD